MADGDGDVIIFACGGKYTGALVDFFSEYYQFLYKSLEQFIGRENTPELQQEMIEAAQRAQQQFFLMHATPGGSC